MVLHASSSHTARWVEERSAKLLTLSVHILSVLGFRVWPLSTGAICGSIVWVVSSISTVDTIASRGRACRLILCICSVVDWNGHFAAVGLRIEKLGAILLLNWGRVVVRYPLLRYVTQTLLSEKELLVLKVGSGCISGVESCRSWGLSVVEPVILHVNLNFLSLARRTN